MLTLTNERFVKFDETGNRNTVRAEILVDTSDELPAVDGISGRILHQGSIALIIKEGRIAVLSGGGKWCDFNGEIKEKGVPVFAPSNANAVESTINKVTEVDEND